MALTYRSPLEEVLTSFSASEQSLIAEPAITSYRGLERDLFHFFNYNVGPYAKEKLIGAGVYLSPFSGIPHSHPVCKTLENHLLYRVLPSILDNSFLFVGIKESKLNFLRARHQNLSMVELVNRYVTSADRTRYPNDFHLSITAEQCFNRYDGFKHLGPGLRKLLPHCITVKPRKLFLHDELHYWCERDLVTFLSAVKPEKVLGTVVYPPELLKGVKFSLNKWCYDFDVEGDDLIFYPDGVRTESYTQPLSGCFYLKVGTLKLLDGSVYHIDVVHSTFCHHLISITAGEAVRAPTNSFSNFDATTCRGLPNIAFRSLGPCIAVPYPVISRVYRYLRTLQKPDIQSAMAKLSQIMPEPTGYQIKFMTEFSKMVIDTPVGASFFQVAIFEKFKGFLTTFFPKYVAARFDVARIRSLDEFVEHMCPYTFKIKAVVHDMRLHQLLFPRDEEMPRDEDFDTIRALEMQWGGGANGERISAAYTVGPFCDYPVIDAQRVFLLLRAISREWSFSFSMVQYCDKGDYTVFMHASKLIWFSSKLAGWDVCIATYKKYVHMRHNDWKRRLKNFRFVGCAWFGMRVRSYEHYICAYPEQAKSYKALDEVYGSVVADLLGSFAGNKLVITTAEERQDRTSKASKEDVSAKVPAHSVHAGATFVTSPCSSAALSECADFELSLPVKVADLNCSCDCTLAVLNVLAAEALELDFPSQLSGCRAGWYVKGPLITDVVAYQGSQPLKWLDFFDSFLELHGAQPGSYDCCFAQVFDLDGNFEYCNSDGGIFDEAAPVYLFQTCGTSRVHLRGSGCCGERALLGPMCFEMPASLLHEHMWKISKSSAGCTVMIFRKLREGGPLVVETATPTVQKEVSVSSSFTWEQYGVTISSERMSRIPEGRIEQQRGDGSCFFHCMEPFTNLEASLLRRTIAKEMERDPKVLESDLLECQGKGPVADGVIAYTIRFLGLKVRFFSPDLDEERRFSTCTAANFWVDVLHHGNHFDLLYPTNDCVLIALEHGLGRKRGDILKVLCRPQHSAIFQIATGGVGLTLELLEPIFQCFQIDARVTCGSEVFTYPTSGTFALDFELADGHLTFKSARKRETIGSCLNVVEASPHGRLVLNCAGTGVLFEVCSKTAHKLAESLFDGRTGIVSSKLFNNRERFEVNSTPLQPRTLNVICGVFGCGKSTLLCKALEKGLGVCIFVTPRRSLAEQMTELVRGVETSTSVTILTFEKFLHHMVNVNRGSTIIFDEFQLYPPGYFDLVSSQLTDGVSLHLLGDPCQSDYDNARDRGVFEGLLPDHQRILQGIQYRYATRSYRFSNPNFVGRLPCTFSNTNEGDFEEFEILEGIEQVQEVDVECYLVSSFIEKQAVRALVGLDKVVQTFGESTGLTYNYVAVLISEASKMASERRWITALTRARKRITFITNLGCSKHLIVEIFNNRSLGRFLTCSASIDNLRSLLPGEPNFIEELVPTIGANLGVVEEKVSGDPWLKTMLFLGQVADVADEIDVDEALQIEPFKTHVARSNLEGVRALWHDKIRLKEHREKRMGYLVSEQFTDMHSKNMGKKLTNAAERFETIYPKHKGSDTVTFIMGARKRLRFSKPAVEARKLMDASNFSEFMLQEFLKHVPLKKAHNQAFMDAALADFEEKKTSKSAATIANHAGRSCRDWLIDTGLVFMKSQHCTKFDNRFRDAKAAQAIVCFQHAVLCRLAPFIRYIERKIAEVLPEKFYIHSGKGLEELNAWVTRGSFEGVCTESDYEAFDASQDQYILAFELHVMKYLGLPRDLIEDYKFIKMHLGSKLGNFAIMRFSGEASTFLFNTMANMLFTFLRYEIKGHERICFAGDDMCANTRLRHRLDQEKFLGLLKLKAKVSFTQKPTFCGWNLCADGIYKKPQLVLERLCIAKETNNLACCIDNYALEVAFAYKMGERAVLRMDEEELQSHYNCVRIILQNKNLIKSNVLTYFSA
uniref:Replicase n=1 Tax=Garlic common latent virus TaxID=47900 RepID=A0A6M2YT24_9VIRU|nr:replicase [Garlic common latent virus]